MKEILFFWGPNCPKCKEARKLIGWHRGVEVTRYNVDTAEGLAEAAFYGLSSTPSIIVRKDGVMIARFRSSKLPTRERMKEVLK